MNLDFAAALATLAAESPTGNAAFDIANGARSPAVYLFSSLLPEINRNDYTVNAANMTVRSTMAGLIGMDSPYPPSGTVELSSFLEESAKIGVEVGLNEQTLRAIQHFIRSVRDGGGNTTEATVNEAINFLNKMVIQPILDTREYLRSRAVVYGAINWTYNKKTLAVDYGVPAGNFLATRTIAGTNAYHLPGSVFWADVRALRRAVGRVRLFLAHPETIEAIIYNEAHGLVVTGQTDSTFTVRRWARNTAGDSVPGVLSADARDQVTFVTYDREAEILDQSTPGASLVVPFMPRGKLVAIGEVQNDGYQPGQGSVEQNLDPRRLGYHHIAPTVEGGSRPGMWAQLYTPESRPWSLHARGADNNLPVIERPDAIAVATTEMEA